MFILGTTTVFYRRVFSSNNGFTHSNDLAFITVLLGSYGFNPIDECFHLERGGFLCAVRSGHGNDLGMLES